MSENINKLNRNIPFISEYLNRNSNNNHEGNKGNETNNNNSNNSNTNNLFQILNSRKPITQNESIFNSNDINNTRITDEDYEFLKAANEVIKLHENKVDPTIRDILTRLQYSNSPHGGLPISSQYLKSIGEPTYNTHNLNDISNHFSNNNNNSNNNKDELLESVISDTASDIHMANQTPIDMNNDIDINITTTTNNNTNKNNDLNGFVIPPFTENPLPLRQNNEFPQFSLDIFKNNEYNLLNLSNRNSMNNNGDDDDDDDNGDDSINNNNNIINNKFLQEKLKGSLGINDEQLQILIDMNENNNLFSNKGLINSLNANNNNNDNNHITNITNNRNLYEEQHDNEDNNNNNSNSNSINDRKGSISENSSSGLSLNEATRNYICNTCGLPFKRSSDLKRHEKIHLKVPPNICPQCHKGFARKDALKRHENTLTCRRNRDKLLKGLQEKRDDL